MKITATNISKVLTSCRFNPKNPGPMRVLSETADTGFIDLRINELTMANHNGHPADKQYQTNLRMIIQLAALGLVLTDG